MSCVIENDKTVDPTTIFQLIYHRFKNILDDLSFLNINVCSKIVQFG